MFIHFSTKDATTFQSGTRSFKIEPIANVKKVFLKSFEFPNCIYNIREGRNTILGITVPEGFYTITDLITKLNSLTPAVFSIDNLTQRIKITASTPFILQNTKLASMLGFDEDTTSTTVKTAGRGFDITDSYIYIHLANLPSSFRTTRRIPASFMISISVNTGNIRFYAENLDMLQCIDFGNNPQMLSKIDVQLLDEDGVQLKNNGVNFSFTLYFLEE